MTAKDYAQALFDSKAPDAHRVAAALARRGHTKLMPQILREYQKLTEQRERSAAHRRISPKKEETRILLELYRTLVATRTN